MQLLILFVFYFSHLCLGKSVSYHGFQVYRVSLSDKTKHESDILSRLIAEKNEQLSEWAESPHSKDVMVRESDSHLLGGFTKTLLIENVQDWIDKESLHSMNQKVNWLEDENPVYERNEFYQEYRSYESIVSYVEKFNQNEKISIGKTYQGRDIYAFKFGDGPRHVVFNGGIHAREWISPATVTYLAEALNGQAGEFLKKEFTFHAIPVLNPDGYHYTRTVDRLWRKNRQPNKGFSPCVGTDPNRNFDINWTGHGGSATHWSCMETYHGDAPMSAMESKALANYVNSLPNVTAYIDIHSYSQLFMYPYGYKCQGKAPDFVDLDAGAKRVVDIIKAWNGTLYRSGDICNTIYGASGSATDYFYEKGVKYSYAMELPGTPGGFLLPASHILPVADETMRGLAGLFEFIATNEGPFDRNEIFE